MINNINVPFPPGVSAYIGIAAIAQLNLEIMQHNCIFAEEEESYYSKVKTFFWLPLVLVGALCLVYVARLAFWRLRPATPDSDPEASAIDRTQRFRDQLCSVGCCVLNMLYATLRPLPFLGGGSAGLP
jgi:hypothetical protein